MEILYNTRMTPITRTGRVLGTFSSFLGGALLPVGLLVLGISLMRPDTVETFAAFESLPLLPLIGLGVAGAGAAVCAGFGHRVPTGCRLGLVLNFLAWLAFWLV